jgi:hypothetical protein
MPRPDKGAEPSMEEILASIRKIIAEEPIGSRSEPARRNSPPAADPAALASEKAAATGECAPMRFGDARQGVPQGAGPIRGRPVLDDALADLVEPSQSEIAGSATNPFQGVSLPAAVLPGKLPAGEPRQRSSWLFSHPHPIPNLEPVTKALRESSQAGGPLPIPPDVPLAGVRAEPAARTVPDGLLNPVAEAYPSV